MKKLIIILGTIILAVTIVTTSINGSGATSLKSGANTVINKGVTQINGL